MLDTCEESIFYEIADPVSDLQSWQGGPWQLSDAFLEVKSLQQTRKQITVSKRIINPHSDKRDTQRASSKVPLGKKNHEEEVRRGWAPMGNPRPKPENTHLTPQKPLQRIVATSYKRPQGPSFRGSTFSHLEPPFVVKSVFRLNKRGRAH